MPVKETQSKVFGECSCCGSQTKKTCGTVCIEDGSEALYIARWTVQGPDHGIAFLILIPETEAYISVVYSFEANAFGIVGEDGCEWYLSDTSPRILDRDEVIGTPLAK